MLQMGQGDFQKVHTSITRIDMGGMDNMRRYEEKLRSAQRIGDTINGNVTRQTNAKLDLNRPVVMDRGSFFQLELLDLNDIWNLLRELVDNFVKRTENGIVAIGYTIHKNLTFSKKKMERSDIYKNVRQLLLNMTNNGSAGVKTPKSLGDFAVLVGNTIKNNKRKGEKCK